MDSLVFLFLLSITVLNFSLPSISGQAYTNSIPTTPNFTASRFRYIDNIGTFLYSKNQTFKASIANLPSKTNQFYFAVIHVRSNTIIWTANRNKPMSDSDQLSLTVNGLSISDGSNHVFWATPTFGGSKVSVMILQDSGNLVLLDNNNVSVWESFDHATDTIVMGQRLRISNSLVGSIKEDDLSVSDYKFVVTDKDAILQWKGKAYWKLSMDAKAIQDSTSVTVLFMELNADGFYLFGGNGSVVVFKVSLAASDFRIAKLESKGMFNVKSFERDGWSQEFRSPSEDCKIPLLCGKIGLCSAGSCSCPQNFRNFPGGCVPADTSLSLYSGCNGSLGLNGSISYQKLGIGIDYFTNDFTAPARRGISLSACQDLCTQNCSCLGLFRANSTGSCYILEENLGSMMSVSVDKSDRVGYVKIVVVPSPANNVDDEGRKFPVAGLVLLPSSGFFLLVVFVVIVFVYWRGNKTAAISIRKLGHSNSYSSSELEIISISGLPIRFEYEELEVATENFRDKIGSGGFGTVYKGTLSDTTTVAVKKMNNLGVQGKKEFCTEIAIIGNVHHVNLVKLKGFCAQRKQWFLVYEYMNRGSLDCALFGEGPVLEWKERFEIALGTARGLAYLHTWCEQKIIHCDVKPENILLHDNLQVKITDFGLSKLLSPEQSTLFTTMRGTRGYLAPEWLTGAMISDKADVYSYGMVLLEIVRGKKNYSQRTQSYSITKDKSDGTGSSVSSSGSQSRPVYFPLLALEMHEKKKYLKLADPKIQGRVTSGEVEKLVRIALCCLHEDPILRPAMGNVVAMLEGTMPLAEPRLESLNFLRFCGRNFTEPSNVEGSLNEQNIFATFPQEDANYTSTTSDSHNSLSYISSQQVSGPR